MVSSARGIRSRVLSCRYHASPGRSVRTTPAPSDSSARFPHAGPSACRRRPASRRRTALRGRANTGWLGNCGKGRAGRQNLNPGPLWARFGWLLHLEVHGVDRGVTSSTRTLRPTALRCTSPLQEATGPAADLTSTTQLEPGCRKGGNPNGFATSLVRGS